MVNQQHQQGIKAANEKGRQRRQLAAGDAVMSRDYRGDQQHQQGIKAVNEKGRQRRQLTVGDAVMSRDYRGDLKWRSGLIVKKTGPLMYEVQVAPGIVWRRHIDQLRPTAVEPTDVQGVVPDTVEASEAEVASPPLVAIQQGAPPNIVGQSERYLWQINRRWLPLQHLQLPILQKRLQPALRSGSGATPRECAKHRRDLISELY